MREILLTKYYQSIKDNELRMKESDLYETEFLTFMAPRMSGWLLKQNTTSSHTALLQKFSSRIGWNRHWFVLAGGCLYYFKHPQDVQVGTFRCMIPLDGIKIFDEALNYFCTTVGGKKRQGESILL